MYRTTKTHLTYPNKDVDGGQRKTDTYKTRDMPKRKTTIRPSGQATTQITQIYQSIWISLIRYVRISGNTHFYDVWRAGDGRNTAVRNMRQRNCRRRTRRGVRRRRRTKTSRSRRRWWPTTTRSVRVGRTTTRTPTAGRRRPGPSGSRAFSPVFLLSPLRTVFSLFFDTSART